MFRGSVVWPKLSHHRSFCFWNTCFDQPLERRPPLHGWHGLCTTIMNWHSWQIPRWARFNTIPFGSNFVRLTKIKAEEVGSEIQVILHFPPLKSLTSKLGFSTRLSKKADCFKLLQFWFASAENEELGWQIEGNRSYLLSASGASNLQFLLHVVKLIFSLELWLVGFWIPSGVKPVNQRELNTQDKKNKKALNAQTSMDIWSR